MILCIDIPLHQKIKLVAFPWLHHYVLNVEDCTGAVSALSTYNDASH